MLPGWYGGIYFASVESRRTTSTSNFVISAFHWKNSCTAPPKSLAASLEEKLCLSPALLHVTRNLRTLASGAASVDSSTSGMLSTFDWASTAAAWGRSCSSVVASTASVFGFVLAPLPPFRKHFFFLNERFSFQTSRGFAQGSLEASSCNSFSVSSWKIGQC